MGSRYVKDLVLNINPVDVENIIQEYLRVNDFKLVFEKGENYYKTGGVMLPLRGFSYSYQNGILHIEAWSGKIGKELNIGDGKLLGAAAKIPYYNSILSLQGNLDRVRQSYQQSNVQMQQPTYAQPKVQMQQPVYAQPTGQTQQPVYTQPNVQMQQPVYAQPSGQMQQPAYAQQYGNGNPTTSVVVDEINKANDRNAIIAFWLSIASLLLIFGTKYSLIINLASYTLAIKYGLKSRKRGFAIAALVINSLIIVLGLVIILLQIIL